MPTIAMSMRERRFLSRIGASAARLARFAVVTVAGLAIDLAVAWWLAAAFGVPLTLAAGAGFAAGAAFNYVLHERWTFAEPGREASVRRGSLYLASLVPVVLVRLAVVEILQRIAAFDAVPDIWILGAAAGISFATNYLLARFVVFRTSGEGR